MPSVADHAFQKYDKVAATALGLLESQVILANLVSRDSGAEFTGAKNDTVNIKRPARLNGSTEDIDRAGSREIDNEQLIEGNLAVRLDKHVYSAVDLTDAELTLDVNNYAAQVAGPQVQAVARIIEKAIAKAVQDNAAKVTGAGIELDKATGKENQAGSIRQAIIKARTQLNRSEVPTDGRVLAVGTDIEAALLNDPNLTKANEAGDSGALRNADLGRLLGFRVVATNNIDPKTMVAFHPSAYVLVNRAPIVPPSVKEGSSQSFEGFALRAIRDYNSKTASERSFISSYMGIGVVKDIAIDAKNGTAETMQRAVKVVATEKAATSPAKGE
ncbi:hypothetical protein AN221_23690 [Streptomyces nanshensis]|uniref:Uncharacterized protein n=1 Tax=Streptomyces nanshensis TaxID=518642 RepID=A0A1E7LPR4_9ACTN|nr:hypothetical protein AN221_23690 [Streptomyces nanshensis]